MLTYRMKAIFLMLTLMTTPAWAEEHGTSYWECSAQDNDGKQWLIRNVYERVATNKAFEMCKKQSLVPKSCAIARESCDYFTDGKSTRPMWQCTSLDANAKPWLSNVYANQEDAAMNAKAYCQEKSTLPDSCYINLVACKNLNETH